jgi:hypothetical protein
LEFVDGSDSGFVWQRFNEASDLGVVWRDDEDVINGDWASLILAIGPRQAK